MPNVFAICKKLTYFTIFILTGKSFFTTTKLVYRMDFGHRYTVKKYHMTMSFLANHHQQRGVGRKVDVEYNCGPSACLLTGSFLAVICVWMGEAKMC